MNVAIDRPAGRLRTSLLGGLLCLVGGALVGCSGGGSTGSAPGRAGVSAQVIATPMITSITPSTAGAGDVIVITGTGFGPGQLQASKVLFSSVSTSSQPNVEATTVPLQEDWTDSRISVTVPSGATTGPIQIVVFRASFNEKASNLRNFVMAPPVVTGISPASANPGELVTLTGSRFGPTQLATSKVLFTGRSGPISAGSVLTDADWTATQIRIPVPIDAQPGPVRVVLGQGSTNQRSSGNIAFTAADFPVSGGSQIDTSTQTGRFINLRLDKRNLPHASYRDVGNDTVRFRRWDPTTSSWTDPSNGFLQTGIGRDLHMELFQATATDAAAPTVAFVATGSPTPTIVQSELVGQDWVSGTPVSAASQIVVTHTFAFGLRPDGLSYLAFHLRTGPGTGRVQLVKQTARATAGVPPTFTAPEDLNTGVLTDVGEGLSLAVAATSPEFGIMFRGDSSNQVLYQQSFGGGAGFLQEPVVVIDSSQLAGLFPVPGRVAVHTSLTLEDGDLDRPRAAVLHSRNGGAQGDLILCFATESPLSSQGWGVRLLVTGDADPTGGSSIAFRGGRALVTYRSLTRGPQLLELDPSDSFAVIGTSPAANAADGAFSSLQLDTGLHAYVGFQLISVNDTPGLFVEDPAP